MLSIQELLVCALALPVSRKSIPVPLSVFLDEARDVAKLYRAHYAPRAARDGAPGHAGFVSFGPLFPADLADEVDRIRGLVLSHDTLHVARKTANLSEARAEARAVAGEIAGVVGSVFSLSSAPRQLLIAARRATPNPATHAQWATFLDALVALASPLAAELNGAGGFRAESLERATVLAEELRAAEQAEKEPKVAAAGSDCDLRDRYVQLLRQRMAAIRSRARYLFRFLPELKQKFTSAYERETKQAAREKRRVASKPIALLPNPASRGRRSRLRLVRSRGRRPE